MNYEILWTELRSQVQNWCDQKVKPVPVEILRDVLDGMDGTTPPAALIEQRIKEEREYIRENVPESVEL